MLRLSLITVAAAALAGAATAEPAQGARVERRVAAMGTGLELAVECASRESALEASEAAVRAVEAVEGRLSTWRADSELSRLNAASPGELVELSTQLRADLEACRRWHQRSLGAFDPSVGSLVRAWDLRGTGRVPSDAELYAARAFVGFDRALAWDGVRVARRSGFVLEEGAFGKGLAIDRALDAWRELGARGELDFGGQVAVLGTSVSWRIADPRDRQRPVVRWTLDSGSISTTGNSEHGLVAGGVRIGHVLDPRTGRPAPDFGSASVWCESAASADAFSTAAFVLGPARALEWAAAQPDVSLLLLEVEGERLIARAERELEGRIAPLAPDVALTFFPPEPPRAR